MYRIVSLLFFSHRLRSLLVKFGLNDELTIAVDVRQIQCTNKCLNE